MPPLVIQELIQAIASQRAQPAQLHETFNPATLLLNDEMDLSRVIGWMLDPAGTHDQGDRYLQLFLDRCGIATPNGCRSAKVRLEVPRYAARQLKGRIDIEVSHPHFLLLIENKPTARFGDRQLERYARTLPRHLNGQARVVALLGAGWDGLAVTAIERDGTRVLRLGTDVRDWVAACESITATAKVAAFLSDFKVDLDRRYAGKDARHVQQIIDLLVAAPETVAASIAIMDARDALTATMSDRFVALVQQRAHTAGLGGVRPVPAEYALFSPNKHGTLRIDIGDPLFDFTISAEATYFRDVAIGICLRKQRSGAMKVYAEQVEKLRGALGPGQSGVDEWWLWWDHVQALDASGRRGGNPPDLWAWASDASDEGLAAAFVTRAVEAKTALLILGNDSGN